MTIDELIEEAARLGGWRLTKRGKIRRGPDCPITAVANHKLPWKFTLGEWQQAAADLRLVGGRHAITYAADNMKNCNPNLRDRMLKAFGLADPTPARVDAGSVKEQH